MKQKGIPSLTGIRGVAAAWVFLTHFQPVLAAYLDRPDIDNNLFLYNGFRGVDLFFILSGFIMMHVHGSDFRIITPAKMHEFYILRIFRVYPLNTIVLLMLLPIPLMMPDLVQWFRMDHGTPIPYQEHQFSAAGFVQSLLLAQTWTVLKLGEWNGPSWTLSAEVFGYAMFPFLACAIVRQRSAIACGAYAMLSFAILVALLVVFGHADNNPTGSFGLIRMIFSFIAGMSLSRCFQLLPATMKAGVPITIGSMIFIALSLSIRQGNVLIVLGFGGLIFGLAFQQGALNTLLSGRPAMFLGRISFPFYLVHYIPLKLSLWLRQVLFAQTELGIRVVFLMALVVTCVLLAVVLHYFIEVPFQRIARRILREGRAPERLVQTV